MPQAVLTSRDRVKRMFARQDHDRIPRLDGYWPETITRWQKEGLQGKLEYVRDVLLDSDLASICWSWPTPFPGREEILEETQQTKVVRGPMGKIERVWKDRWGTPEHISFDCDSPRKWQDVYKPALLSAKSLLDPAKCVQDFARAQAKGRFTYFNSIEGFEAMRQLVGDEIVLVAMAEHPEWVRDMSMTYTDLVLKDYQAVLDAGAQPDAVWVCGDVGYNHGPFFSPAMYRELIRPEHIKFRQWAHQRGMKFIYHTDGDVRSLMDSFVEAGFDCLQPLEAKAGMDVRQLVPVYGDRLSFLGNIDMTVAGTGNPELIEHEVRSKLAAGMSRRCYAYHSDHSVPPTVSWASYRLILDLLDRYGSYR